MAHILKTQNSPITQWENENMLHIRYACSTHKHTNSSWTIVQNFYPIFVSIAAKKKTFDVIIIHDFCDEERKREKLAFLPATNEVIFCLLFDGIEMYFCPGIRVKGRENKLGRDKQQGEKKLTRNILLKCWSEFIENVQHVFFWCKYFVLRKHLIHIAFSLFIYPKMQELQQQQKMILEQLPNAKLCNSMQFAKIFCICIQFIFVYFSIFESFRIFSILTRWSMWFQWFHLHETKKKIVHFS